MTKTFKLYESADCGQSALSAGQLALITMGKAARTRLATAEFKQRYAKRAGVEGTLSQGTRRFELRRSRYIGLAKTHLQHIATAAAMNLTRLMSWLSGVPQAKTRTSPFFALAPTA